MTPLILTDDELHALTGYRTASRQLGALQVAGFSRARIVMGKVVLERAHYEAVCRGERVPERPKVRQVQSARPVLRSAA